MVVRYYSSTAAETQLTGTISPTALTINVLDVTGFPVSYPYTLAIDYESASEELVDVTAAAGGTLTVTRAVDGTSATSHSTGARVRHVSSARDFRDSRNHENSDSGVHGLTGDVVGTSDTQILTNKTINSPTFGGSFSGTLSADSGGKYRSNNVNAASLVSTDHPFQIGLDSSSNLRMDVNDIQAVNNGGIAGLALQRDGGVVSINLNLAADNSASSLQVNGAVDANAYTASRASSTAVVSTFKADADTQPRFTIRSDGRLAWGPGGSGATDSALYRTGVNSMEFSGNINAQLSMSADSAFFNSLTVASLATLPKAVSTGGALAVAQSGWSLSSAQSVDTGGVITVQVTVTRTGANIVAPSTGNIPDTAMVQLNSFALPNPSLGDLHFAASNSSGVGAAYMTGAGLISIQSWVPSQTIATGDNISVYLTYVQ